MEKIQVTKLFDVNSPVGAKQRGETQKNYSIGTDLYMPKDTETFRRAFYKANQELHQGLEVYTYEANNKRQTTFVVPESPYQKGYVVMTIETDLDSSESIYEIHENCQIPSGIAFNFPHTVWGEVRSKSSNFKNGFTVIHGTVDCNYTYGVGIQLVLLRKNSICLESDQKIAQIVLHKAEPIYNIEVLEQKVFDNLQTIQEYRKVRDGGFGSTGKFEKTSKGHSPEEQKTADGRKIIENIIDSI